MAPTKSKRKRPVQRSANRLLNVNRKAGKHTKAIKHNAGRPLLRLPGEIRNIIWGYVLGGHTFEVKSSLRLVRATWRYTTSVANQPKNSFALLQACRQIYAEAACLPQKLNTFWFKDHMSYQFILRFAKVRQEALREIRIATGYALEFQALINDLSIESLPGLQRIVVGFRLDSSILGLLFGAGGQTRFTDAEEKDHEGLLEDEEDTNRIGL